MTVLTLRHGNAVCAVYPALGGSIGCWAVGGQAMLRTATTAAIADATMLGMASFPLVPYSNRIGRAQFEWQGRTIAIAPNFAPEPHAIHGVGWRRRWTARANGGDSATLTLEHAGDTDWPWPFTAEQRIVLTEHQLILSLRAINRATEAVPLGFGHHPYFDAMAATLRCNARTVWLSGADRLPIAAAVPAGDFDFTNGLPVSGRAVDHCFTDLTGPARIAWTDRRCALEIRTDAQLPAAVIYIPRGGDAFCFEPVPHLNNALNWPDRLPAVPIIAPGDVFETMITFTASPR